MKSIAAVTNTIITPVMALEERGAFSIDTPLPDGEGMIGGSEDRITLGWHVHANPKKIGHGCMWQYQRTINGLSLLVELTFVAQLLIYSELQVVDV